jgi:hypothetical protein
VTVKAKKLPAPQTLLAVFDDEARKAGEHAREQIAPIVSRETPRKRGVTAAALAPRVRRTPTGVALTVGAPRGKMHPSKARIAQVVRWVNRGTGLYRTTGLDVEPARPIRSNRFPRRRLILPGGRKVWSVKGQHPNTFMERIETLGTLPVEEAFEKGARDAARAIERVIS